MFGSRLSLKSLANICRSLSTTLQAGVPILKAWELAKGKTSNRRLQSAMDDVSASIRSGWQLSPALAEHDDVFPDLMVDMVGVAEGTGMLPEVFRSLSEHYENSLRLKKEFISQITWPVIQFVAAVFIIAGLILIMGLLGDGANQFDPLGFGLFGVRGALIWLGGWAGVMAAVYIVYRLFTSSRSGQRGLFRFLMRLPVVGGCLEAFAAARFSWAFYITQEAAMPIGDSLRASLKATSNAAFVGAADSIVDSVNSGETLTDSLAASDLFTEDFVQMIRVGETTGTVPETLHRLSPQFEDQARRSLKALAAAAGWAVWCGVAAFLIFLIFRIFLFYIGEIDKGIKATQ